MTLKTASSGKGIPARRQRQSSDSSSGSDTPKNVAQIQVAQSIEYTRADLNALILQFVNMWDAGLVQRTADWYKRLGVTLGGSEISGVLGMNPYSSFYKVCKEKLDAALGIRPPQLNSAACSFGILFESIAGRCLEIDLMTEQHGDKICIQALPGHRYSPDGYAVIGLKYDADGELRVHRAEDNGDPDMLVIVLLEYKCPWRRRPDGKLCRQYAAQPQSGLAVSPMAHCGLFVDSLFRKCALQDLGPNRSYDLVYHSNDLSYGREAANTDPLAWGLIAIYAPCLEAPRELRMVPDEEGVDAACVAWELAAQYMGSASLADEIVVDHDSCVDVGELVTKPFERVLELVNKGMFRTLKTDPYFDNGRGFLPLSSPKSIFKFIRRLQRAPPRNYYLFGVLPWKLFEMNYVPVNREPHFIDTVKSAINEVQAAIAMALATPDPHGTLIEFCTERSIRLKQRMGETSPKATAGLSQENVDDFFADCSPTSASSPASSTPPA